MCMACEDSQLYYHWMLLEQIAKGETPDGLTEDDLRAMGLPVVGELEMIEKPDGSHVIRRVELPTTAPAAEVSAKARSAAKTKAKKAVSKSKAAVTANAFVCDTPDDV